MTENLRGETTMMMQWTPERAGRWLFHCHFQAHISNDERVPIFRAADQPERKSEAAGADAHHDAMSGMNDMAGLVLAINVKPAPGKAAAAPMATSPHRFDLVIEPTAASGKSPTFSCSVREGKKIVASAEKSMGPTMVVTRGEPTEITVTNHLAEPTTIHWHGL